MRLSFILGFCVMLSSIGCTPVRDSWIPGRYEVQVQHGGSGTLVLRPDGTLSEEVRPVDGPARQIEGTWERFSRTSIDRTPCFAISYRGVTDETHEGCSSSITWVLGAVQIGIDPDYGVAYRKH